MGFPFASYYVPNKKFPHSTFIEEL